MRRISNEEATASDAREKAATKLSPSPCSSGRTPPWAPTASFTISSRRAVAEVICSGSPSHRRLDPSMSARTRVTVPAGRTKPASPTLIGPSPHRTAATGGFSSNARIVLMRQASREEGPETSDKWPISRRGGWLTCPCPAVGGLRRLRGLAAYIPRRAAMAASSDREETRSFPEDARSGRNWKLCQTKLCYPEH